MNVLVATGIYPPEIGGPATVMALLVQDLRSRGHDVTVVTYGAADASENGVVRVSRRRSVIGRYAAMARTIRRRLGSGDVLFATDVFSVGIPVRLALIGRRAPFVLRLGGEWAWEDAVTKRGLRVTLREYWSNNAHGPVHGLKRFLAHLVLSRANRVVVTSSLLCDVLDRIDDRVAPRVVTVPNDPTKRSCIPAPHAPSESLRVLYAGRFAPVKNVPMFAQALRAARDRGAAISMLFVGDGEERAACERILDGVSDVRFLGVRAPHDIENLLSETDLYVLPSLSDICPNGVLEAVGCGVPCLVTREHGLPTGVGGVRELDPKDERAWTDALVELATDRAALGRLRSEVRLPPPPAVTLRDVLEEVARKV